ncbi:MAG: Zn-ribbon domain-containing OB-fold protein [Syntrophobacteraceae bacterium]|nr:Zn-ribbon domain-containing OB-fold protein [Syntrophobacteraceae bacterium]
MNANTNMRETLKQKLGCRDEDFIKPLPAPAAWSKPFWEGARQHKLLLKKCKSCGHIDHPPYLYCTECSGEECEWIETSGKATLYSYAVNVYGVPFAFMEDLPYVLALVDLAEGPRMISNIVGCAPEDLQNGMELEVVFDDVSAEITLPKWKPISH